MAENSKMCILVFHKSSQMYFFPKITIIFFFDTEGSIIVSILTKIQERACLVLLFINNILIILNDYSIQFQCLYFYFTLIYNMNKTILEQKYNSILCVK